MTLPTMDATSKYRPGPHSLFFIRPGNQQIGPELAACILKDAGLGCQAERSKSGRLHVLRHVENMRRGHWIDYSQISFCRVGHAFYLVNGYHRVMAIVEYGRPMLFSVVIHECDTYEDVISFYAKFDRSQLQRSRSDEQALNSIDFAETLGTSKTVARSVYRAIPLIRNGMRPVRIVDEKTKVEMAILETRTDAALAWKTEAAIWGGIVDSARGVLKRKLLNPACTAVALFTIKYQRAHAIIFWSNVAKNDGLPAGSPEHTLIFTLLSRRMFGGDEDNFIIPALAWNAYFRNKPLKMIKAGATGKLVIAGTPVGSRGAEDVE